MVAAVARYHGGAKPRRKRDDAYAALPKPLRRTVRWLSAMLRVAEGLDRSHYQLVRGVVVRRRRKRIAIVADARRHAQLELWAARQRADELAKLLGHAVVVEPASPEVSAPRRRRVAAARAPRASGARSPERAAAPPAAGSPGTKPTSPGRSARRVRAARAERAPRAAAPAVHTPGRATPRRSARV